MPATVWKGHLTFGLVSIPVRLFRAARAQRVNLRQLYRPRRQEAPPALEEMGPRAAFAGGGAAQRPEESAEPEENQRAVWSAADQIVPVKRVYEPAEGSEREQPLRESDLVKGYEYAKGEYVVLDEQELRSITPKTSTEMQIVEFVRFGEIDPVYLETSYYVAPEETGEKAYALLFQAMEETGYAAIGQVTMHRRDHVVIVRAGKSGLIAHTMYYADEVRTIDEFRTNRTLVSAKELELARTLVGALAASFEPDKFKNEFRARLHELIESRAANRQVTRVAPAANSPKVIDIMDALRRSLEQARKLEQVAEPQRSRKPPGAESPVEKRRSPAPRKKS